MPAEELSGQVSRYGLLAVAVFGLLAESWFAGAVGRIAASRLETLVITDSIRATEAVRVAEKIRVITVAPLIGEAIRRISDESSVSSLFD